MLALAALTLRPVLPQIAGWLPPCPLHTWTGWHCPGCGSTRAVLALARGDWREAWAMNPLLMVTAMFGFGWLTATAMAHWRGKPAWVPNAWVAWSWLGAVVVFAATRNLPWWPFTLLAPH